MKIKNEASHLLKDDLPVVFYFLLNTKLVALLLSTCAMYLEEAHTPSLVLKLTTRFPL